MRRGILGGTFDPPHIAHLFAGEMALHQQGLDVITYVPAGAPWQKADRRVSDATHRWAMTELAIAGIDYFEADDREVHRDGWTFTIDTIESFDEDVALIVGADSARRIRSWHRADELLARTRFVVAPRPGIATADVEAALAGADWVWLTGPEIDVSSTELRAMVGRGDSVRFLVPDTVRWYISEHSLYVER